MRDEDKGKLTGTTNAQRVRHADRLTGEATLVLPPSLLSHPPIRRVPQLLGKNGTATDESVGSMSNMFFIWQLAHAAGDRIHQRF